MRPSSRLPTTRAGDSTSHRASDCPGDQTLAQVVEGDVPAAVRELVHDHMASCARCRKTIAALTRALPANNETRVGRYRIDGVVGEGGMGVVVAGHDLELDRPVAIKVSKATRATPTDPIAIAPTQAIGSSASRLDLAHARTHGVKGSEPKHAPVRDTLAEQRFQREAKITARLQHPSIVPVYEVGRWDNGEPFYAMKRVDGRSLHELIGLTNKLEERLTLLPNVLAVADAIAYAHSRGVLHRDLKPHNILIGAFGETVVIDWGLARETRGRESDPRIPAGSQRGAALTMTGEIMGTPAYMPPEQAVGDPLDERADVYALGATLYHLLAGRPPYSDAGRNVLAAIVAGPPTPLPAVDPGIPADLLAVVAKAMAWDRNKRYGTAKEVADDLRRFTTGQLVGAHRYTTRQLIRRWIRAHRGVVALAAGSLLVLAVVVALGLTRIVEEQHRAEKNREDAEDLMGYMLGDLKGKLQPIGKLALLEDVAYKAHSYYEQRPELAGFDDQRRKARSAQQLGEILVAKGDLAGALASYRSALALSEEIGASEDVAVAYKGIGDTLQRRGDVPAALDALRAGEAVLRELIERDSNHQVLKSELAAVYRMIGTVLVRQGDLAAALVAHQAGYKISEQLAAAEPANPIAQATLSKSLMSIGDVLQDQGDIKGSVELQRKSVAIREQLVAKDPENPTYQRELFVTLNHLGNVLGRLGDGAAALETYRRAKTICEQLVARDPNNREWQHDLVLSQIGLGDHQTSARGDVDAALVEYRAANQVALRLAAIDPGNAQWQDTLAMTHTRIGNVMLDRDVPEAIKQFRAQLAVGQKIATADPNNAPAQAQVVASQMKLSIALMRQSRAKGGEKTSAIAEALAGLRASEEIIERFLTTKPDDPGWQERKAILADYIANIFLEQGNAPEALLELRASLMVRRKLVASDPKRSDWQFALAASHANIAGALLTLGDRPAAVAEFRSALDIFKALQAAEPTNAQWNSAVVTTTALMDDAKGLKSRKFRRQ
ncbi:MAG: tetratricopeptide repeat protein [Kofleriaceae bacterium]